MKTRDTAFEAKSSKGPHRGVTCFRCGETGHYQKDCKKPPGGKKKQHSHHYRQSKHCADKAEKKGDDSQSESEPESQTFITNTVLKAGGARDEGWIIVSGASKHDIPERSPSQLQRI